MADDDRPAKPSPDRPAAPQPRRLAMAAVAVPLVAAVALAAFAWPAASARPRHVPLGLAGPPAATARIAAALAREPGAFDARRYPGPGAARRAIEHRAVAAAIVAPPGAGRPALLIASAASPTLAQLLPQALSEAAPHPRITDVVPADPDDPRGAAFGAVVLPLVLAGMLTGVLMSTLAPAGPARAAAVVASAALTGLAGVALAEGALGILPGPWAANAAALGATVLAIASIVGGLTGLLGQAGIGIATALMVFVGNPWSGMTSARELLPEPAATIGALLPPGAGGALLRSTAFFGGARAGGHITVLAVWIAAGLGLIAVAARRHRRTGSPAPADDPLAPG